MDKMNVSVTISSHLENALQELVGDNRIPENHAGCVDTKVQHIEHKSYDGFIAFTNGGLDLMLLTDLGTVYSSGTGPANEKVSNQLDKIIASSQQDALESFVQENKTVLQGLYPDADLDNPTYDIINYHDLYNIKQGELAETLSEIESEWFTEGGTFWYQFRVIYYSADNARNETGKDEMYFLAGTNLDFEYGRDSGLECTYEKTVPVELLTTDMIDGIINDMVDSI